MPKKKAKKRGDKQDEGKTTPKKETPAENSGSHDKERDLYLTQIRYLNEELEGYQLKCDDLERQKKASHSQYVLLEKEKRDIADYLKHALLEKEDEVEELSERLESQRQAADKDRDALQLQHDQLRRELQDRIEELNGENKTLVARLAGLEEFQRQREQLMSNMASLEEQLARQEEQHKADVHDLEMKALLEKRRLEKEMESHVAAMAAEVQHRVDQKVPEATRLALQENEEVKAQFSRLSEQAQVLMTENSHLQDRKSKLAVDVDILEQMLSEISRKSCIRKKVVEQLTDKCQQLQAELDVCRQEHQQLQTEHKDFLSEMETLRQGRASLSKQCSHHRGEASRLEAELQEERRRRSGTEGVTQEAAAALRRALMDSDSSVAQWKQLMQKLLLLLDRPDHTETTTSDPAAARAATLDPALSFQFQMARYRPGDLGLVPPKHKHVASRMGAGSVLPLHRKPSSQKTTSSTGPTVRFLTSKHSAAKLK